MEPITEIRITVDTGQVLGLDEALDLQGNLKDLDEDKYVKLRNSITKYGFSFPLFIWLNPDGQKLLIDGHQRVRTLKKWRDEGIVVPNLPVVYIQASSRTEAKEKLLLLNSRYGKMTREGFDEFIDEPDFKIEETEIEDLLAIPEVEMWNAPAPTTTQTDDDGIPVSAHNRSVGVTNTKTVQCPSCSHEFEI